MNTKIAVPFSETKGTPKTKDGDTSWNPLHWSQKGFVRDSEDGYLYLVLSTRVYPVGYYPYAEPKLDILALIRDHKIAVSPSHNHSLGKWMASCHSIGFTIPEAYFAETLEEAVLNCYEDVVVKRNITEYDICHRIIKYATR